MTERNTPEEGPRSNGNPQRSVNGTEFAPKDLPRPAGGHTCFLHKARPSRPSEPILIPKLRIQFADFPYLHYSIDQRLLTLETCCGYGYELVRFAVISLGFSRSHRALVDAARTAALFAKTKTHSPCERIPGPRRLMQKRQLFPELQVGVS